ncbi:MAG: hypothetical protein HFI33_08815 [Lachnospiraceae bacterium]|nr:hypothetical protein [Lachnospiraceae bacterium]
MKKLLIWMMFLFPLFTLTGCGKCEHKYTDGVITKESSCAERGEKVYTCSLCKETRIVNIPLEDHTYIEEITKEPTFDEEGEKTFTCENCGDLYTESIPIRDNEVTIYMVNKTNLPKDTNAGRYSDRVEFHFEVANRTNRTIKGVQGILTVYDMFGKEILTINCDFTGESIPGKNVITFDELGMEINPFIDTHVKLYTTDFSDLKFTYKVTDIVYDDGENSTKEQSVTELTENPKIIVSVLDKQSLDVDFNVSRYSPRVNFTFQVFNNTSKNIKGVQGVLTIKDLFGVDIMSGNLDFTGETIPANYYVIFRDLGLDINKFMDEHVKVYTTDFSDLKFEYNVTSIVYTDGTME